MATPAESGMPLSALIVEDSLDDCEILVRELRRGGYALSYERVDTEPALTAALARGPWDIVFADFSMPQFSGTRALACVRAHTQDVPFIFVSGTIGEDIAVTAMKATAQDYIMKGNLKRLVPAVQRELRESQERRRRKQIESEHRAMEARLRNILTMAADAIIAADANRNIIVFNQAAERLFGYTAQEIQGKLLDILLPEYSTVMDQGPMTAQENDTNELQFMSQPREMYGRRKDGSTFPAEANLSRMRDNGHVTFTVVLRDVTERKRQEESARLLRDVELAARDAVDPDSALTSALGRICHDLHWSIGQAWALDASGAPARAALWHCRDSGLESFRVASLEHEESPTGLLARARAARAPVWIADVTRDPGFARASVAHVVGLHAAVAFPLTIDDEIIAIVELFAREVRPADPAMMRLLDSAGARIATVMQRKRAEERIQHLAHHDALTDLPNRVLFHERLRRALWDADRHERLVGVAFLDLDRFKTINDSVGHAVGDQLLKAVAAALTACVREGDTVARLAGDEFAVVFVDVQRPDEVGQVANRILKVLGEPFTIEGRELFTGVSMGLTLYPIDNRDADGLLQNADIAMYRAKEGGGNSYQFYSPEMTVKAQTRHTLENDLRHALDRGEFLLYYQPLIALSTNRIVGAEALIRWRCPGRGIVGPGEFIPIAEETGLIGRLGAWVVHTASAEIGSLALADFTVSVNCSARQFQQATLCDTITEALASGQLAGQHLEIEITESLLMQTSAMTLATMERLNQAGITFAVDDFGTGYSSLAYLKQLPISRLKIDQSFVRDVPGDANDVAIVRAIISMAHGLGIQVVAEGVETSAQLEFLRAADCDTVQGYYFARPVPFDVLARRLRAGDALPWPTEDNTAKPG